MNRESTPTHYFTLPMPRVWDLPWLVSAAGARGPSQWSWHDLLPESVLVGTWNQELELNIELEYFHDMIRDIGHHVYMIYIYHSYIYILCIYIK